MTEQHDGTVLGRIKHWRATIVAAAAAFLLEAQTWLNEAQGIVETVLAMLEATP